MPASNCPATATPTSNTSAATTTTITSAAYLPPVLQQQHLPILQQQSLQPCLPTAAIASSSSPQTATGTTSMPAAVTLSSCTLAAPRSSCNHTSLLTVTPPFTVDAAATPPAAPVKPLREKGYSNWIRLHLRCQYLHSTALLAVEEGLPSLQGTCTVQHFLWWRRNYHR